MQERYTFLYSPSRLIVKYNTLRIYLFGAAFLIAIIGLIISGLNEGSSYSSKKAVMFERISEIPVNEFLCLAVVVMIAFLAYICMNLCSPLYLVVDIDKGSFDFKRKYRVSTEDILFIKLNDFKDSGGYIHSYLSLVINQLQSAKSIHISESIVDNQDIKVVKALSAFLNKEIQDLRQHPSWGTDL
jgi:hypothetical protein